MSRVPNRTVGFILFSALCVAAAVAVAIVAVVGSSNHRDKVRASVAADRPDVDRLLAGSAPVAVFRDADKTHGSTYGSMTVAPVSGGRLGTPLTAGGSCSRLAYAAGHGLCLDTEGTKMNVSILDDRLKPIHELSLAGIPSRARISPDGHWGGTTAFVVGHAYAAPGTFSTVATILDLTTGRKVGELEKDFKVTKDGRPFTARDRNYWGLTFAADGDTFYATAESGGDTWLIKGSIRARTAKTIHRNVECPALSPDGTRIAYKKALTSNPKTWRFTVLDLATGQETPLAETRSIDDQAAWLDDGHVLYADSDGTTWVVPADGSGKPQVWMRGADSATVS